jgi:hypothetical protein
MMFISSRWYSTKADDTHLPRMIFIKSKRHSSDENNIHSRETNIIYDSWFLKLQPTTGDDIQPLGIRINHWGSQSTTGDHNQPLGMLIGRHRWYIVCSRWIYYLPQMNLSKIHLDPNYLPRKISNIHFYDSRQKTKFFQFITPNLEFIYYLWFLIIKMESFKEEKIVSWSGKMLFSNHLP